MTPSKAIETVRMSRILREYTDICGIQNNANAGNHSPLLMNAARYCKERALLITAGAVLAAIKSEG